MIGDVWKMHNVLKELLISLLMLNWWKIKLKQQASPDHEVPWILFREEWTLPHQEEFSKGFLSQRHIRFTF